MKKMEVVVILAVLGLDALTKTLTSTLIPFGEAVTVIPDFFWLTYVTNTGAAWSLLSDAPWFFTVLGSVASVVILALLIKAKPNQPWYRYALVFLFAGAFGNVIDRLMYGHVRDFLAFNLFGYPFPVFNVADISLNVGVGCMLLDAVLDELKKKRNHA